MSGITPEARAMALTAALKAAEEAETTFNHTWTYHRKIAERLLAADHLWTEPATRTVNEPLIVKAIRRNPVGTLEWHPVDGPKTGTSGRSFLAELDASGPVPTETEGAIEAMCDHYATVRQGCSYGCFGVPATGEADNRG